MKRSKTSGCSMPSGNARAFGSRQRALAVARFTRGTTLAPMYHDHGDPSGAAPAPAVQTVEATPALPRTLAAARVLARAAGFGASSNESASERDVARSSLISAREAGR